MSEYFSTTAQAGNAGLLRSDKVVVCLAGFIVREGRVNFNFLRGKGGYLRNNRNDYVNKGSIFCSVCVLLAGVFFFLIIRAKIFFINFVH